MKDILLRMKRIILTLLLLFVFLSYHEGLAQSNALRVEQKGGNIHFVNKKKGIDLAIKNQYYLDLGGFLSYSERGDFEQLGIEPSGPGIDKFHIFRTTFEGSLGEKWRYNFMLDYSNRTLTYHNMQVDYRFNREWFLRIGNQRIPVTMSRNYSTSALMHLDTPMGLSLSSPRRLGVGVFHSKARHSFAFGLYTKGINEAVKEGFYGRPDLVFATRGTYNVLHKRNEKLLFGLNAEGRWLGDESRNQTLKGGVQTSMSKKRFLNLPLENLKAQINTGLEVAYQNKRFLVTGEYLLTHFLHNDGNKALRVMGWNVQTAYQFFGKPRGYRREEADFSGSPFVPGKGALEGGIRYTALALNHGTEYRGGQGAGYAAFLTYWWNEHLAFSLQGTYLDFDQYPLLPSAYADADLFFTQLRIYFNF